MISSGTTMAAACESVAMLSAGSTSNGCLPASHDSLSKHLEASGLGLYLPLHWPNIIKPML